MPKHTSGGSKNSRQVTTIPSRKSIAEVRDMKADEL
jgi:hypothetical protein